MSESTKTRDIYYGGFSAAEKADLETPVPPPGGSIGSLGQSPLGEGRNEAGVDLSAARNAAIREAACRRHIEALRREEAAIRAGIHPEFLARAKIVRQEAKAREAEINAAASWKVEVVTKMWENEEQLIKETDRATSDKDEQKRLRQAEVQRLRDSITRSDPGNKFRRATRGSGIPIISDPDALEPHRGCTSTKSKSTNIKAVLGLSKNQLEDDLATLRADASSTNAAGLSTTSTVGGSGIIGGGLRAKGLSSGGTRASPSAVGSSSGGGSVARSSGKGKGKGKSLQKFDKNDGGDADDDGDRSHNDRGKKRSRSRDDNDDDHHNGSDNERSNKRSRSRDDDDDDGGGDNGSDSDRGKKRSRSRDDDEHVDVEGDEARASVESNKRTKATK